MRYLSYIFLILSISVSIASVLRSGYHDGLDSTDGNVGTATNSNKKKHQSTNRGSDRHEAQQKSRTEKYKTENDGKFHIIVKGKSKGDVKEVMNRMSILNADDRADVTEIKMINTVAMKVDQSELLNLQNNPNFIVEHVHQYTFNGYEDNNAEEHMRQLYEHTPWGVPRVLQDVDFWDNLGTDSASPINLCIVDSGYDLGHEDLPKKSDGVTGVNKTDDNSFWGYDLAKHGTHVAGIAAALGNNDIGVRGVFKNNMDGKLGLMIAKVSDGISLNSDIALKAIEECANKGANVINMSFSCGSDCYSKIEESFFQELHDRGILLVAAAGNVINDKDVNKRRINQEKNIYNDYYDDYYDYYYDDVYYDSDQGLSEYPASYPTVLSVASSTFDDIQSDWSTTNSQVEVSAPGQQILSTLPDNKYVFYSGTSMASPHVSAVAALVWMYFTNCTNLEIRKVLAFTALDIEDEGCDERTGYGVIQAKDAYDLLAEGNCGGDIGARSPIGGCSQLVSPCLSDVDCTDGDACTEDLCEVVTGMCTNRQLSCEECGKTFQIDILNDLWPTDVSWEVEDSDGAMIEKGNSGSKPNAVHTEKMCLENGSYIFTIKDKYGGICCEDGNGVVSLYINSVMIYENKKFDTPKEVVPFDVTDAITSFPTAAPTNCKGEVVTVKVKTDRFPQDTKWKIKLDNKEVKKSDAYASDETKYSDDMCLEDGVYLFTIYDAYSDGICCAMGKGSYKLIVGGKTIKSGGDFEDKEETYFIIGKKGSLPSNCNKKQKKKKKKKKKKKTDDTTKCVGNDKKRRKFKD